MAKVGYLEVRVGAETHKILVAVDDESADLPTVEVYVGANILHVPCSSLSGVVDVKDDLPF